LLTYGKIANPQFLVITYFENEKIIENIELTGEKSTDILINGDQSETVSERFALTVLGPSDMVLPNINISETDQRKNDGEEAVTFGSLLEKVEGVKSEQPRVESMKNTLIQGIKTQDNEKLSSVLHNTNMNIVQKTVAGLPTNYVIPLLKYIISKFRSNPKFGMSLIIWMKVVLIQHTSYLMTVPELVKLLAELYTTIDSRVSVLDDLLKLQGRMELLLSQINKKRDRHAFDTDTAPLSVYNEEEDEDNMDIDEENNEMNQDGSDDSGDHEKISED